MPNSNRGFIIKRMNEQTNQNTSDNTEIDKALKEFEAKNKNTEQNQKAPEAVSTTVPQRAVEGVQFETNSYRAVKFYGETDTPKMIKLMMKISGGSVKSEKQAEYILLGFVVVAIIISLFLFFSGGGSNDMNLRQQKLFPPGSPAI